MLTSAIAGTITHYSHDIITVNHILKNIAVLLYDRYIMSLLAKLLSKRLADISTANYYDLHIIPPYKRLKGCSNKKT